MIGRPYVLKLAEAPRLWAGVYFFNCRADSFRNDGQSLDKEAARWRRKKVEREHSKAREVRKGEYKGKERGRRGKKSPSERTKIDGVRKYRLARIRTYALYLSRRPRFVRAHGVARIVRPPN
ncbi:hypothetical protein KM043_006373 [Ampulex compressa]|nr:hypothetical protein KM043_006373 [Ampulex compressa]